ncbi:MAG: potassium channel family protein [Propionibacteriaceae bacterium]|nr:potassium channel family protein [Propionibacteriaceae bacterium]
MKQRVYEILKDRPHLVAGRFFGIAMSILIVINIVFVFIDTLNDQPPWLTRLSWWVEVISVAIFTVGYGDVYPLTLLGKLLAAIIAVLGVLLVAIPTGILSAGFMTEAAHQRHDVSPQETPDMEDQSDRVTLDRASTAGGDESPPE